MNLSNDIVLRPRFKIDIPRYSEAILSDFHNAKATQKDFVVIRVEEHVFIRFPRHKQNFWSPQLHLEVLKVDDNNSTVKGLFGPNPTIWTLFMFSHFLIACLFITSCIWMYTNWSLEQNFALPAALSILMVLVWVSLYFAGSYGKAASTNDMRLLNEFMHKTLDIKKSSN